MTLRICRNLAITLSIALTGISAAKAAYYPEDGDLYYNGQYYMDSIIRWNDPGPWSVEDPGYEHDLHVHNPGYFASCTTMTTLPSGYDDCPTAGILDPNGPVFSFGSFEAKAISANKLYWGGWQFAGHATPLIATPFTLYGQENENRCLGLPTILCMFATQTQTLISGWWMLWNGNPSILVW